MNLGERRAVHNRIFVNPVYPDIDGIELLSRVDQHGPLFLNRAAAEVNDSYLTDAGRIGVRRFNVDGGERQVAGSVSSLCRREVWFVRIFWLSIPPGLSLVQK